jgi:ELWxxDGT repeat protein
MVKDINPTGDSNPSSFAAFNGSLYFQANTDAGGYQLWKTDGTAAGTVMVANMSSTGGGGHPSELTVAGGKLFFSGTDGTHGYELWVSDGVVDTTDHTHTFMVKDINSGSGSSLSTPAGQPTMVAFNNKLYFVATDGGADVGNEIWTSDGTSGGTFPVTDIATDAGNGNPYNLTVLGSSLYFAADDGTQGTQLYKSDGSWNGNLDPVKLINTGGDANPGGTYDQPEGFTVFNGNLYFSATEGTNGVEPWKSDGTSGGTNMLKNINTSGNYGGSSFPLGFTAWNGSLYFQATDGPQSPTTHATELWKSDGTSSGTNMLKDINTGANSNPIGFTAFNGSLYFDADDGTHGYELWKSDGTAAGTVLVADINVGIGDSFPSELTSMGTNLYFRATDSIHGSELWKAGDFSPPETQIDSGPSGTIATSSASFSFSSDEAGTFQCSVDGGAMSACSSPKALSGLADGGHSFQVRAIDSSGNVDASPASRSFVVDTIAPETQIASGPSGFVKTKSATFAFSSSETGSSFECKLDGAAWAACSSPKSYTGLADGKHTFDVRAKDLAGNIDASPASRSFTVDTHAPQTKIGKHPKKVVSTKKAMVTVTFTLASSEKGSHFACKLDKKGWKSCSSRTTYKVKLGKHTFQVRATDRAGNTDSTPAKWTWSVKRK